MNATVVAVHARAEHRFSKEPREAIQLLAGLGVEGDAHCGARVRHRSRVAADPSQPNLRQVHLLQSELFEELAAHGHSVSSGELGENVTTVGVDLLSLPVGSVLRLGSEALVALTGLRNPCAQIEEFQPGLLGKVAFKGDDGTLVRRAGVMGVVILGGRVCPGDPIEIASPPAPHVSMERV